MSATYYEDEGVTVCISDEAYSRLDAERCSTDIAFGCTAGGIVAIALLAIVKLLENMP